MIRTQIRLFYQSEQREGGNQAGADVSEGREAFTAKRLNLLLEVKDAQEPAKRAEPLINETECATRGQG